MEYDLQWNEHSQGQHSQGPKAIITSRITPGLHERAVATKAQQVQRSAYTMESTKANQRRLSKRSILQQTHLQKNTEQHELFPKGSTMDDRKRTCSAYRNTLNCLNQSIPWLPGITLTFLMKLLIEFQSSKPLELLRISTVQSVNTT